jgi:hypothetical protein
MSKSSSYFDFLALFLKIYNTHSFLALYFASPKKTQAE